MWTLMTFLTGVLSGISLVAASVWYIMSVYLPLEQIERPNERKKPSVSPSSSFHLPSILENLVQDESYKEQETCWAINFVLFFLFRELKNSEGIRRWILRKLTVEFEELLATSVLGKFFSNISVQSVDVGGNFPILNWIKTTKVELHPIFKSISTVDILADLDYSGGFQFAIQADTHLKHSVFLSIQFNSVKGQARLQFSTEPYAHWSFSFAENPDVNLSVLSHVYGKSFSHITNIIASQLKRSIRKKHTLPMYKLRYKPFFQRVEPIIAALVPDLAPAVDNSGNLDLSIIECRGLMSQLLQQNVYTTIVLGEFDCVAAYVEKSSNTLFVIRDLIHVKSIKKESCLGFTLKMSGDYPVIESLNDTKSFKNSSFGFLAGDEVLHVDGKKVVSVKQCIKFFKGSSSMKVVWRIRRKLSSNCVTVSHPRDDISVGDRKAPLEDDESGIVGTPKAELDGKLKAGSGDSRRNSINYEGDLSNNLVTDSKEPEARNPSPCDSGCSLTVCEDKQFQFVKTPEIAAVRDPIFEESLSLNVKESYRFVNIAVWSSQSNGESASPPCSPSRRKNPSFESQNYGDDRLVATLTLPLADIVAECGTTGLGFFVQDYYLRPPDGIAADARDSPLVGHSGFQPDMCYGKITLSYLFRGNEEKALDSVATLKAGPSSVPTIEIATDALTEATLSPTDDYGCHQFVRTNFRTATFCDYCNKKIWLKEAFSCSVCSMKCHKKCHERCIANTVCRGDRFPSLNHAATLTQSSILCPEVTCPSDVNALEVSLVDLDDTCVNTSNTLTTSTLQPNPTTETAVQSRRKTLSGLIVSAVQNRSVHLHLRRTGSASNLLTPNTSGNTSSRSLPPSPKASPTTSRKASVSPTEVETRLNPFDVFGCGTSEENINAAVDHLIRHPNDDFVSLAKEQGRNVYSDLSLSERKQKLNQMLNRLQEEIDVVSSRRMELSKEVNLIEPSARSNMSQEIAESEERIQAIALLMLYFCSGLQQVQDLEEQDKDSDSISASSSNVSQQTITEHVTEHE